MDYSPVRLKSAYDYLAPDKSEIRLLCQGRTAGLCHCTLPAGQVSTAVRHRKVEECWYVLEGKGQIWRETHGVSDMAPGISVVIRLRVASNFAPMNLVRCRSSLSPFRCGRVRTKLNQSKDFGRDSITLLQPGLPGVEVERPIQERLDQFLRRL